MLPIIFIVPIVQMVILVYAATLEMKHIEMSVVDKDLSATSRQLISKFKASSFFYIENITFSLEEAENKLKKDKADIILHIPAGFEKTLIRENSAKIQLLINAINGAAAGLTNAYASMVISDYNKELIAESIDISSGSLQGNLKINYSFWYNPEMNYKIFMAPGILVILVTVIGMLLSALNLVREKELGTIEQINVTPIKRYHFIIGKLLPFWFIALFDLAFGLFLAKLLFDLPMVGSIFVLYAFASIYLLAVMGIGLFISTISSNQQQVMFLAFFFMIVFILMSGIFTPVESMPGWAQKVNLINPLAYFMRAIRMIILKGSGFQDIAKELFSMSIYAIITLSLAVWRYRKVA